jgi:hypothetical protein
VGPGGEAAAVPNRTCRGRAWGGGGGGGWAGTGPMVGRGEGDQAGWAKKGGEGERGKEKGFPFSKVYFLDECFHNFNQSR